MCVEAVSCIDFHTAVNINRSDFYSDVFTRWTGGGVCVVDRWRCVCVVDR